MLDQGFLWTSLVWGAIGSGYLIYGWRQKSFIPFLGGLAMIVASYFIANWWLMSLACLGIIALVYWMREMF
jgi:hypothetical protein